VGKMLILLTLKRVIHTLSGVFWSVSTSADGFRLVVMLLCSAP
jgi:hypothetical protein